MIKILLVVTGSILTGYANVFHTDHFFNVFHTGHFLNVFHTGHFFNVFYTLAQMVDTRPTELVCHQIECAICIYESKTI